MFDSETQITGVDLARLLGCDRRSIGNYVAKGLIVKAGRGRYRLQASLQALFRFLTAKTAGRKPSEVKLDANNELALLRESQRRLNEQKFAENEGRLLQVELLAPAWDRILVATRQRILAVPSQCRFALPHLSASDKAKIDDIVRDALTELSETAPPADKA